MRQALAVLPVLAFLALPASASAEARYPYCPPTVGDRTLTSTSQRGDEAYPQIVCWYEKAGSNFEFDAGWGSDSYTGDQGPIGCGKPSDDPMKKIISLTHHAYIQSNYDYQDMPGFEAAMDDFLDQLETDFAKPCGAEEIRFNLTRGKQVVPSKPAAEYCGTTAKGKPSCAIMDDTPVKVCNKTRKPQTISSKSKHNRFSRTVKPGKCFTRRFNNPSREEQTGSSIGGGLAWVAFHLLIYPDSRILD